MRYYELMLVVSPQLDDEGMAAALDRVNRYVTDRGGNVVRQEPWGRLRRLAYPIRNFNEANYVLTHLEMDPQDTKDLEASLHLTEDVLRHLLLRIDSIPPAPAPRVEPAVAAAAETTGATTEAAATETAADGEQPAAEAAETTAEAAQTEAAANDAQPAATAEAAQTETAADDAQPAATAEAAPEATAVETAPEAAAEPAAADESPPSEAAAEETDQPAAGQAQ